MKRVLLICAIALSLQACVTNVNVIVAPHAVVEAGSRNIESVSHGPDA